MAIEKVTREIAGRTLTIETGRMARQAHGAVTVQYGDTVILAAAVGSQKVKEGQDFFPLMVDYRERTYAAGKIPGGFFKREGRPTEKEILTSRLIDRPVRSLFVKDYFKEVNITVTVLSVDGENATDIPAMIGASAALLISPIPFESTMGAVRVGLIEGQLVANPTLEQLTKSDLDLILAGTKEKIVMIEAGANEISEEQMFDAIKFGHSVIREIIALQEELRKKVGLAKDPIEKAVEPAEIVAKVQKAVQGEFEKIYVPNRKEAVEDALNKLYTEKVLTQFDAAAEGFDEAPVKKAYEKIEKNYVREMILSKGKRPDGRAEREIRKITCEVGVLPRTHGSSLFTRGQTQSLSVVTLGTEDDKQRIDGLEGEMSKSFMLHYNFPPFSVGETGPNRGPGRREIGHGALAERSLSPIVPQPEDFPYVLRLVSDILESNGSSSMATVCGGTLALMDAGVPIKAPVSGIAIGLITGDGGRWKVLTDIAGVEDHLGDMDFKAAGTRKGLTALQMDLKISGVTDDILREAFDQAKEARFKILDAMQASIAEPRASLSQHAPRILMLKINPSKIGEVIGPGGKNIRRICEETGAKINIDDTGTVLIASVDSEGGQRALEQIQAITTEPEIGKIYEGEVQKLAVFGAFIEVLPGTDGLCHISEVTEGYAKNVTDFLKVGMKVPIKVLGIDERGKISLSIKQAKEGGMPELPPDVERDILEESPVRSGGRGGRPGGGGRDRGSRPRR